MKRNRTQLFCGSLYLESLRQLRLMGLIYLACCLIFTVLPTLLSSLPPSYRSPSAAEFAPILYLFVLVAPLTLAYSAFGYLMRRNASDFYHSLPMTRECMYVTRALAVATYLVGTVVLSLLSAYLTYVLCGQHVNWSYLPYQVFYFSSCALLVMACSLIGLTLTGTFFSAFVVSGLVLFLPRLISFLTVLMIGEVAPIVSTSELGILLDMNLNLPASWFAALFSAGMLAHYDLDEQILSVGPALYTGVLALIYLVLGGIAHHFRSSETALKSAPNRVLQHVYRCAISLPLFLAVGMMAAMGWSTLWNEPSVTWLLIATAFLVYFIYELITTKKLRNLLPALAVLPIVLAVSIGIPLASKAIGKTVMHIVPDKARVVSVNLDVGQYNGSAEYTSLKRSRIDYADESLNDLLLRGLTNTIGLIDNQSNRGGYHSTTVRFNLTGSRSMTRRIYLTPDDYARLTGIRDSYAVYHNALIELPADNEITKVHGLSDNSDAENWLLWQTFRQEYAALDDADKMRINTYLGSGDYVDYGNYGEQSVVFVESSTAPATVQPENGPETLFNAGTLTVSGVTDMYNFFASYSVTELTPKTLLLVMDRANQQWSHDALAALAEAKQAVNAASDMEVWIYNEFSLYDPAGEKGGTYNFSVSLVPEDADEDRDYGDKTLSVTSLEGYAELLDLLLSANTQITDLNSPIVLVEYANVEVYDAGFGVSVSPVYLRLSGEALNRFHSLVVEFCGQ